MKIHNMVLACAAVQIVQGQREDTTRRGKKQSVRSTLVVPRYGFCDSSSIC